MKSATRRARRLESVAATLAALLGAACGRSATEFGLHAAAAERAYAAGRYLEASREWSRAAVSTARRTQRDEARYRQAASLQRAGHWGEAATLLDTLVRESPAGDHAARAAYDSAVLAIEHGERAEGYAALDRVLRTYPNSGVAAPALRRYLTSLSGEVEIRSYLATLSSLDGSELGQYVHYAWAGSLEASGELPASRARYVLVAERYPHPTGALWDDALWKAADLDVRLGEPKRAVERLEALLREREPAFVQGSYERARYAEARFRIGELYRDRLSDAASARAAFERLWTEHPRSRLRDDAKWNAAMIAVSLGDSAGACRDLDALIREAPDSRYVPCAGRLCPSLAPAVNGAACHDYLTRSSEAP